MVTPLLKKKQKELKLPMRSKTEILDFDKILKADAATCEDCVRTLCTTGSLSTMYAFVLLFCIIVCMLQRTMMYAFNPKLDGGAVNPAYNLLAMSIEMYDENETMLDTVVKPEDDVFITWFAKTKLYSIYEGKHYPRVH